VGDSATPREDADGWWLLRDGDVLCAAEVASTLAERSKGLLGRKGYDGALVLNHTRAVHSLGMRFALDVAFLDRKLVVLDVVHLRPWRMTLPRIRGRSVLEAEMGAFDRWGLKKGDCLELRLGK
jgi:uncharacterized membrane protein (UPF0127 family)